MAWLIILGVVAVIGFIHRPASVEAAEVTDVIADDVARFNGDPTQIDWITNAICYASGVYQVDPLLITAVMETESHFNFQSFSYMGAIGLMQLMPDTAAGLGYNPYDPLENVVGGTAYLRLCLDSFAGYGDYAVTDAVAAYNAGIGAVQEYGGCPPYAETEDYVVKVNNSYTQLLNTYYYY